MQLPEITMASQSLAKMRFRKASQVEVLVAVFSLAVAKRLNLDSERRSYACGMLP
jgi:hypothetical protein